MALHDELLAALRLGRVANSTELAAKLGVSQPTLSRLIVAAGDRVCRMGRARATRYALRRTVAGIGSSLPVRRVDANGNVRLHGALHLLANGRNGLQCDDRKGEFFAGLPLFAWDMSPQGYIGRNFSAIYPELELPPRISEWNDDHRLIALARRGEDCVGDLIVGDESFSRFLASTPQPVRRAQYPIWARRSFTGQPGSSAVGEQPKFAVFSEGRHVLVKFASGAPGPVTQRWKDLLVCEHQALEALRDAGIPAASAQLCDVAGAKFLEVERFDRVGKRGRKGLVSLYALGIEYLGFLDNWTRAARDLLGQHRIAAEDARRMCWLDAFGQLIGNTDRHFGNISFHAEGVEKLQLAPTYDMLPMIFAPQGTNLVERQFTPLPPSADNFEVWADAARQAVAYWDRLARLKMLGRGFRKICAGCRDAVQALADRIPSGSESS
jgi:hypothetical protein